MGKVRFSMMKHNRRAIRRLVIGGSVIVGGALLVAAPASAHTHYLTLPDGSVQYVAGGGSDHVEGADWHPIHCLVHIGTPGTKAFDNTSNPVDIAKTGTFTGTCTDKPGALPRP